MLVESPAGANGKPRLLVVEEPAVRVEADFLVHREIDDTIIRDKGKTCVGEAIKAVLNRKLRPTKPIESSLPATASPGQAFGPSVEAATGDFIKTEVIFGC